MPVDWRFEATRFGASVVHGALSIDPILPAIDSLLRRRRCAGAMPSPVFVLGAPRSGTTVLYDLLAGSYRCVYPTNLASLLYRSPVVAQTLADRLRCEYRYSGSSRFGYVTGLKAPSEAGKLMRRWFEGAGTDAELRRAREQVGAMSCPLQLSMVSKNTRNLARIPRILETFPEALFVFIERESEYVAQSLLTAREALYGDRSKPFGLVPGGVDMGAGEEASSLFQVAEQVVALEAMVVVAKQSVAGAGRMIDVRYESLCMSPKMELDRIVEFATDRNARLDPLPAAEVPEVLSCSNQARLPAGDFEALCGALEQARARRRSGRTG